jgi:hypothetical protein
VCGFAKRKRKEGCAMRKFSLILTILLLTAPALATVTISCDIDGSEVTISYSVADEPNKVRAFALDISVSGANIVDVNYAESINGYYRIFPGSIVISGEGEVVEEGTPVADPKDPGSITDGNAITIEMGALYTPTDDSSPNAPPDMGDLLKFTMDGPGSVAISENETRGGVVLTDPNEDPEVDSPGCGARTCWDFDCFGCGDSNGDCLIAAGDVMALVNSWPPKPYDRCADFNKDLVIASGDVMILVNHWPPKEACPASDGCSPCTPVAP